MFKVQVELLLILAPKRVIVLLILLKSHLYQKALLIFPKMMRNKFLNHKEVRREALAYQVECLVFRKRAFA